MEASKGNEADSARRDDRSSEDDEFWVKPAYAPVSKPSIRDYAVQAFLGEGSTAHVYMATRVDTCEVVAIKFIDKLLVRQAQMEHKVRREILLHSPLRHRHVVRVREAFEDARYHYLVLEYCEGGSVASLARSFRERRAPMDEATAKSIFRQTAAGVSYLHARGIIHRDLKLSNLLLTHDGDIKISDFGLATLINDEHGTVCGTPNFIAPEVLSATTDGLPYDETVDIWSLGCILYTLMLGKPPFEGTKVSETLTNVGNAGRQPLEFPHGFSATIGDLIKRMLSRDANMRPAIAQVLAHPWLRAATPTNTYPEEPTASDGLPVEDAHDTFIRSRPTLRISRKPETTKRRYIDKARKTAPPTVDQVEDESDVSSASAGDSSNCDFALDASLLSNERSDADDGDLHAKTLEVIPRRIEMGRDKPISSQTIDVQSVQQLARRDEKREVCEVHFLRLCVHVSDLPFLGIDHDSTREIYWDCWESSDIRQLTRFTLRVGDKELEYVPSKSVIQEVRDDGSISRNEIIRSAGRSSAVGTGTENDSLERIVRLCQCLASRSLQLRRAAMATDDDNLPIVHYDRLPESILKSLRRESVRTALTRQLEKTRSSAFAKTGSSARCVLPGVGVGEFSADGRLVIQFFNGPILTMNAIGSTISYCRAPGDQEDEYDLGTTTFLPSEVKKYFEHVPTFIRQLKMP